MLYCDTIINKSKKKKQKTYPLNYVRDPEDNRDFKYTSLFKRVNKVAARLTTSMDHSNLMSSIKDQGTLGSCVGFAVTAMKEWQEKKEHLKEIAEGKKYRKKGEHDLSESWLYWNSKKIDPWPGQEGTSIRYAMKVLNKIGVPTESAWPYKSVNVGKPKKWAKMIAVWALIDKYWRIDTLTELRVALATNPVPIGIPCFSEIFSVGADGIVPYPSNPDDSKGGHAVCAVGYNNDSQLIKFKNSWGPSWGENGYGYLSYDYIRDFLWDAWTCTDISVTRDMLKETRSLYG